MEDETKGSSKPTPASVDIPSSDRPQTDPQAFPEVSTMSTSQEMSEPVDFGPAVNYINKVKARLQEQPDSYDHFLKTLNASAKLRRRLVKDGRPSWLVVKRQDKLHAEVSRIFEDHADLLEEFEEFLPYPTVARAMRDRLSRPTVIPRSAPPANSTTVIDNYAISFAKKVWDRFQTKPDIFDKISETIIAYRPKGFKRDARRRPRRRKTLTADEVHDQVTRLFEGHDDLMREFEEFWRDDDAPASALHDLVRLGEKFQSLSLSGEPMEDKN